MESFFELALTAIFLFVNFIFANNIIRERLVPAMIAVEEWKVNEMKVSEMENFLYFGDLIKNVFGEVFVVTWARVECMDGPNEGESDFDVTLMSNEGLIHNRNFEDCEGFEYIGNVFEIMDK